MHAQKHPCFQASLTRNTGSEVSVDESGDPTFHPCQTPNRDLAGKYGDPAALQVILQGSNSAGSQNPPSGDSTLGTLYRLDPLGLNQYPRWNDPLLAIPVITPG